MADFNYRNYNVTAVKVHPDPAVAYFYCISADPEHPERGVDSDVLAGLTNTTRMLQANVAYETRYRNATVRKWDVLYPIAQPQSTSIQPEVHPSRKWTSFGSLPI